MARKMLGVFTAVAAAMLLVGVAWAGTDSAEELSSTEATAATIPDERVTAPTTADDVEFESETLKVEYRAKWDHGELIIEISESQDD